MMTKKQFANTIIECFCFNNKVKFEDAHNHIMESFNLAVALEFLGMLTQKEEEYFSSKDGLLYMSVDKKNKKAIFLTARDLISLLPDELD